MRLLLALGAVLLLLLAGCATTPSPTTPSPTTPNQPNQTTLNPTPNSTVNPTMSNSTTTNPVPGSQSARWVPTPGTAWQWQLTNPVDTSVDVPVYDVDGTYTAASTVAGLHALGRRVICYVNAGAYENFRPDSREFPARVLGDSDGWPGEQWLDIRQLSVLRPIMLARFQNCKAKGFDAIEADEVDGYENDTGFPLTAADQLAFDEMLANLAHGLGLSIGLKNDYDQVAQLVGDFDFAIDEQCFQYQECEQLLPFIRAGKAVLEVEYSLPNSQFCAQARAMGFSAMRKNLALDPPRWPC